MLHNIGSRIRRYRILLISLVAAAGLTGVVLATVPGSAYYTSTTVATADGLTGHALLTQDNPGVCQMHFGQIDPGHSAVVQCNIKNGGNVPLHVAVTGLNNPQFNGGNHPNLALLSAQIDGIQAFQPVTAYSVPLALGDLNPGQNRTYTFRLALAPTAGNEWQDTTWSVGVAFTGTSF